MAYFAELDKSSIVVRVVVVHDNEVPDEATGATFCEKLFGGGTWMQTSYNGKFRGCYATIGARYDSDLDAFIPAGYTKDTINRKIIPPMRKGPDGKDITPIPIDVDVIADVAVVDAIKAKVP